MSLGIRARLFLGYLVLVAVLGASGFILAGRLLDSMRRQISEELLAHTRQTRWLLEEAPVTWLFDPLQHHFSERFFCARLQVTERAVRSATS